MLQIIKSTSSCRTTAIRASSSRAEFGPSQDIQIILAKSVGSPVALQLNWPLVLWAGLYLSACSQFSTFAQFSTGFSVVFIYYLLRNVSGVNLLEKNGQKVQISHFWHENLYFIALGNESRLQKVLRDDADFGPLSPNLQID